MVHGTVERDAASGLVRTVVRTAADMSHINVAGALLYGEEQAAFGDSRYPRVHKRAEAVGPGWQVAIRPGKRRRLTLFIEPELLAERVENMRRASEPRLSTHFG